MNQAEKISYILETILNCDEYIVPSDSKSFFDIIWIKETKKCSESDFNKGCLISSLFFDNSISDFCISCNGFLLDVIFGAGFKPICNDS